MPDDKSVIDKVLAYLAQHNRIEDSWSVDFVASAPDRRAAHREVVGALQALEVDEYVTRQPIQHKFVTRTADGDDAAANGSPEFRLLTTEFASNPRRPLSELPAGPARDRLLRNKWVKSEKAAEGPILVRDDAANVVDSVRNLLN